MSKNKPIIALMYDFDKTLSPTNMQEYGFIPNIGMKSDEFWNLSDELSKKEKMDRVLSYMYLMVRKSKDNHISIKREAFVKLGENIEFFPGVEDWFSRINEYGKNIGVIIEHYIISSGMKEIIEGCSIYKQFKEVFGCEFHYDENGTADWPKTAVNYTGKTQFLFRINKGVLDLSDDDSLNKYIPNDERRIPFRNMIYLGDGLTDVPCMKLVKVNGGQSIAVYKPYKKKNVEGLLQDKRVDFIVAADYTEGSELDRIIKTIIDKMTVINSLVDIHRKQQKLIQQ
ncbi:MAG: phosphoserine phosphatase [Clostridiales bacterium GWF2_38_85]|nr:MAG: phosphoserine phosphatase [Clostridiales bacterium GWF2_38_85]HBL85298.1 phosphoserine phosphatase [Clostridiales bacterium]